MHVDDGMDKSGDGLQFAWRARFVYHVAYQPHNALNIALINRIREILATLE